MRNPTRALAIATVTMLALVGCTGTPTEPATTATTAIDTSPPTATTPTSVISTSSATRTPTPTTTYDQALLAKAMDVNEQQFKLEGQYFKEGGWPRGLNIPHELTELMMDEGLARTVEGLNQTYEKQIKYQSGEGVMSDVRVAEVPPHKGSLIALQACRDARGVKNVVGEDKTPSQGALSLHTTYYKRDTDGKLKMSYYTGKRVESCGS